MIGAVLAQRAARASIDVANRRDIEKMVKDFADDATYTFPGHLPIGGVHRGKTAIRDFLGQLFEGNPDIKCTLTDVFVSNIFAMGATNSVAIEYEVDYTSRDGKKLHNSGLTVLRVKGGKVVSAKDYIFDTDISREAWRND